MNLTDLNQAIADACEAERAWRAAWNALDAAKRVEQQAKGKRDEARTALNDAVELYIVGNS